MNQYILLNRIKVQNANAIAGFTWGFPAITHFLGFSHNLSRKLHRTEFDGISLAGCTVIAHHHKVHTYKPSFNSYGFTQSRNPPYLSSHDKAATPPVIEEGKMNFTVSLLIGCEGNIGNRQDGLIKWLKKNCLLQRLAGGTILEISNIEICIVDDDDDDSALRAIKRKLLPGFMLIDRSNYLEDYFNQLQQKNTDVELLNAWLDFVALKQKARPKSNLLTNHLINLVKTETDEKYSRLLAIWKEHLAIPYHEDKVPVILEQYFQHLENNNDTKKLLAQWQDYCTPNENTEADWEYINKPESGYLVPIMVGYKAISGLYQNNQVNNTRDNETPICFVESAHSIGEWLSVHRLKNAKAISDSLWHYHYEENWYLCKQTQQENPQDTNANAEEIFTENPNDDFYQSTP